MSSHIVTMNTQEVREANKKNAAKKRNKRKKEKKQANLLLAANNKQIEQRNPYQDQIPSSIRSGLLKIQQEEITNYDFKYFSNKPKTIFNTSFSRSFRNDILRFSEEDTLFTPTFLGKRMTEDEESLDESSEEVNTSIIELSSSDEEEEIISSNQIEEEEESIENYSDTSSSSEEEKEQTKYSSDEDELVTSLKKCKFPEYNRQLFTFTPVQSSSELIESPTLSLKEYQLEAINFLFQNYCEFRPSCLAHEMGLGKTVISLSTINAFHRKLGVFGPFLIVVPLITLPNWEREAKKWVPHFERHTAWGTLTAGTKENALKSMVKLYSKSIAEQKPLVVLTTYEFLKEDVINSAAWACVIFDEAHKLKSQKTQSRRYVNEMKKDHFILLTGTPMQNSPAELWSLLNLLDPQAFPKYKLFEEKYGELDSEKAIEDLKVAITPYLLRRTKRQVLKDDMPPKEEILIEIEMSSIQKSLYRAIIERKANFFRKQFASKQDLTYVVNNLRYCCDHPCLLSGMEEYLRDEEKRDAKSILIYSSSKMVVVHKLLKKFRDSNDKTIILSQFLGMLDILEAYLQSEKISFVRIDGSLPSEERQISIDKFQTDPDCRVFLLSTKIAQGINLTAANHVIIYDSDFNPFNDSQAAARAHRIGQQKKVFVYRLITKDSYEKYIISRASKKLGREKLVLAESNKSDEDVTAEEMARMIKFGVYSMFLNKEQNINKDKELQNTDIDRILEGSSKIGVEGEEDGAMVDVMNRVTGNDKPIEEKQGPNEVIKSVYFVPVEEAGDIALDDPHFWDKTFPDYCDIYTLEARIENFKPFEANEFESYFKKLDHVASEAIQRKQIVSDETEKLGKVVEEDRRGLPTKHQLHTFLLKFNSPKFNRHHHCLQKEHLDKVEEWIEQLETKTLRNKKVWDASSTKIEKTKKSAPVDVDTSDDEFDLETYKERFEIEEESSEEEHVNEEELEELERETELLHNMTLKEPAVDKPNFKKKQKSNSGAVIMKEKSEKASERSHKKPQKKQLSLIQKLKQEAVSVTKSLKPTPTTTTTTTFSNDTWKQLGPKLQWHNIAWDQSALKLQQFPQVSRTNHQFVQQPIPQLIKQEKQRNQTVQQPSSSSNNQPPIVQQQVVKPNGAIQQSIQQLPTQFQANLLPPQQIPNQIVTTPLTQPVSQQSLINQHVELPNFKKKSTTTETPIVQPILPRPENVPTTTTTNYVLKPLSQIPTYEILSRMSQASPMPQPVQQQKQPQGSSIPQPVQQPIPQPLKQQETQRNIIQQPASSSTLQVSKTVLLKQPTRSTANQQFTNQIVATPPTSNTVYAPSNQQPIIKNNIPPQTTPIPQYPQKQQASSSNQQPPRTSNIPLATPQTFNYTQPNNQQHLQKANNSVNQTYPTRPIVTPVNLQPAERKNQVSSSRQTISDINSDSFLRSLRHNPASFQQMIQPMSLNNLKSLSDQYFKNYTHLTSSYRGSDKQQLIASSINLLTIINTQIKRLQQASRVNQHANSFPPQQSQPNLHVNPLTTPNITTPTVGTNTTYQAYYTQSDGLRTMTTTSSTTTIQNATTLPNNPLMMPGNPNTIQMHQQQHQQHQQQQGGLVGMEYYRSIISQSNNNQTVQSTTTTRVQRSTPSTPVPLPPTPTPQPLLQLPPPSATTTASSSTTIAQSSTSPSQLQILDFSSNNTDFINNWFN